MDTTRLSGAAESGDPQNQPPEHGEQKDDAHSGEGAASALAHLKSQVRQHRHLTGEADDAAGSAAGSHPQ